MHKEQEAAARRGEGDGAVPRRTRRNSEEEAVGATDVVLTPTFAVASTASGKTRIQVGVPELFLAASSVGTSTWTEAPIPSSAVGVPEFLLVPISAGTSTSPRVLGEEVKVRLRTPCVAKIMLPSTLTTTHDDSATGEAGTMWGREEDVEMGVGCRCRDGGLLRARPPSSGADHRVLSSTSHVTTTVTFLADAAHLREVDVGCIVAEAMSKRSLEHS